MGRCEIYNVIKKGYGVRSKTAHGEPLKGTEADVVALLTRLDDYLRSLFKLDKPYDLDVDKMNEYYIKRLLGDDIAPRINDTRLE